MSAPEHEIPKFQIKFTKVCLINTHTSEIKHVDCTDLNDFIENFPSDDYKQQRSSWKIFYAVPVTDHEAEQAEQRARDYFDRHYLVEGKEDQEHGK